MFPFWWLLVGTSPHFLPLCKLWVWMVHEDLQSKCNSTLDNFAHKMVFFFSHLFVLFVCLVLLYVVSCGMFLTYLFVSFLQDHLFQCSFMVWSKREWNLTCIIPKHYCEHTNQFWTCIYYYQHTFCIMNHFKSEWLYTRFYIILVNAWPSPLFCILSF
jgi:hypothetical protein